LIKIIKKYNIKSILEIGTANSYSSHIFARYGAKVLSLEKNYNMYNLALKNLINSRLNKNIQVLFKDALLYDTNKKFDMIFIDGSKTNYLKFFQKFQDNLNHKGIIIADNINFHKLKIEEVNRRTKKILLRINEFKEFLKKNKLFKTIFLDVGDGISISKKVK